MTFAELYKARRQKKQNTIKIGSLLLRCVKLKRP